MILEDILRVAATMGQGLIKGKVAAEETHYKREPELRKRLALERFQEFVNQASGEESKPSTMRRGSEESVEKLASSIPMPHDVAPMTAQEPGGMAKLPPAREDQPFLADVQEHIKGEPDLIGDLMAQIEESPDGEEKKPNGEEKKPKRKTWEEIVKSPQFLEYMLATGQVSSLSSIMKTVRGVKPQDRARWIKALRDKAKDEDRNITNAEAMELGYQMGIPQDDPTMLALSFNPSAIHTRAPSASELTPQQVAERAGKALNVIPLPGESLSNFLQRLATAFASASPDLQAQLAGLYPSLEITQKFRDRKAVLDANIKKADDTLAWAQLRFNTETNIKEKNNYRTFMMKVATFKSKIRRDNETATRQAFAELLDVAKLAQDYGPSMTRIVEEATRRWNTIAAKKTLEGSDIATMLNDIDEMVKNPGWWTSGSTGKPGEGVSVRLKGATGQWNQRDAAREAFQAGRESLVGGAAGTTAVTDPLIPVPDVGLKLARANAEEKLAHALNTTQLSLLSAIFRDRLNTYNKFTDKKAAASADLASANAELTALAGQQATLNQDIETKAGAAGLATDVARSLFGFPGRQSKIDTGVIRNTGKKAAAEHILGQEGPPAPEPPSISANVNGNRIQSGVTRDVQPPDEVRWTEAAHQILLDMVENSPSESRKAAQDEAYQLQLAAITHAQNDQTLFLQPHRDKAGKRSPIITAPYLRSFMNDVFYKNGGQKYNPSDLK